MSNLDSLRKAVSAGAFVTLSPRRLDGWGPTRVESAGHARVDAWILEMYVVHVKTVTATEARRGWFRLLDEVVEGEVVVVDRHGVLVELRRLDRHGDTGWQPPEYDRVLRVAEADTANHWGWDWDADTGQLCPVPRDEP